jgi:flagellar hook-basal body complex protein FliE
MSMPISAATAAYGRAQNLIDGAAKATPNPAETKAGGNDFGEMVSQNVQSVLEAGRVSDQKSMEMVGGSANVVDVVTAIAETEVAVETMVTIRDRVISAYEEIMRMPI